MRFERGSAAHVEACLDIARALRTHFDEGAIERMPGDLRTHRLYVAEDDGGKVVGFLSVLQGPARVAEITWMAVRPDLQGRGIGSGLLSRAVDELVAEGVLELLVRTLADTVEYAPYQATRAFYRSSGFHLREVMDPYPGWAPGNPCAVYVRSLG